MKDFNSITLIHKSLTGQITPEENNELQQWLDASPHNRNEFTEIKLIWESPIEEELFSQEDSIRSRQRLEASIEDSIQLQTTTTRIRKTGVISIVIGILAITTAIAAILFNKEIPKEYSFSLAGKQLILPDSSLVVLNDSTNITNTLSSTSRTIHLDGEAFFNINKELRPLTIITEQCNVKVKGTSLYLRAHQGQPTEVWVTKGKVELTFNHKTWQLKEGDFLSLKEGVRSTSSTIEDPNFNAWQTERLQFKQAPLAEVIYQLEKFYNVEIVLTKERPSCYFTGTFENLSLKEVFTMLSYSLNIEFETSSSNHYTVIGKGCLP